MDDGAVRLPRRLWPRSRRRQAVICIILLLLAALAIAEWYRSQPDAQVKARITVLRKDPILTAFRAHLGQPDNPVTRWKCTMELPPAYSEDFHAKVDTASVQSIAAIARDAGWKTRINQQPDNSYTVELHKSFGTWASDSLLLLHHGSVTVELDAVDNDHASC
jgi:hypothetical protein